MTARDPAFEVWIEEARRVTVQQEIMRRGLWSRLMLGDNGVPCPGCGGRDRFAVNLRKNVWNCRASGVGGDAIALAQHIDGTDFLRAVETVTGRPPPKAQAMSAEERHLADLRKSANDEKKAAQFREKERLRAYEIWRSCEPIKGTLAEDYLAQRGLTAQREARLRFHPGAAYWDRPKDQGGRILHHGPVLAAAIEGPDGRFAGVHRTWIDLAQPNGKAHIIDLTSGDKLPAKKVRGSVKGGSILLARPGAPRTLYLGEGIETVLSVFCALRRNNPAADAEFRAAVSLGNMAGRAAYRVRHPTATRADSKGRMHPLFVPGREPLDDPDWPIIPVPESVTELVLLGDGDSEPFFTRMALQRAVRRFAKAYPHLSISIVLAAPGSDFNDMHGEAA